MIIFEVVVHPLPQSIAGLLAHVNPRQRNKRGTDALCQSYIRALLETVD